MRAQERLHARLLGSLAARGRGASGAELGRLEGRHRNVGGNALRAAVLGANDGLSSNLSLVMGVAGAATDQRAVVLAGVAGLVAGAASMALGEWISVTSSRELAQRELETERSEIELEPEDEREELELLYRAKGLEPAEARALSAEIISRPEAALDVLFVGPNDLSQALGIPGRFDDPRFGQALRQVGAAAAGRAAGVMVARREQIPELRQAGFRFFTVSVRSLCPWNAFAASSTASSRYASTSSSTSSRSSSTATPWRRSVFTASAHFGDTTYAAGHATARAASVRAAWNRSKSFG